MITLRKSDERGKADHGWLQSNFSFSFADYYDPDHMHFRALRVINEDYVAPGQGFGTHPHSDMEILTYIVSGELAHKDSMGNGRTIRTGELQAMSAGTRITHSEFNPSASETVHLLQIWILPRERGLRPSYSEWIPSQETKEAKHSLLASPDGRDGSVVIHTDASLHLYQLKANEVMLHPLTQSIHAWVQVISGNVMVNERRCSAGDAAALSNEPGITLKPETQSKFLVFDLA